MAYENVPDEAQYLKALTRICACVLLQQDEDGAWIARTLDAAAGPPDLLAAALLLAGPEGGRAWIKRDHSHPVIERPFGLAPPEWGVLVPEARALPAGVLRLEMPVRGPGGRPGATLLLFFEAGGGTCAEARKQFGRGVADVLAMGLERLRLRRRIQTLAIRDDVTEAFNYRFLKTALKKELARSARQGEPLSVIMLDVDRLKDYNDRFGHLMGSALLQELAQVLGAGVRKSDWVAKYGGDEFLIILPSTEKSLAIQVGERLRDHVRGHAFERSARGEVTASFGVASYPEDGGRPRALVQAADRALYRAKHSGRNRLCVAGVL